MHCYSITTEATSQAWNNSREKKKLGRISNLQEAEAVKKSANKPLWPMFTIVDSRRRYKEFIAPVVIEGKNVDMELDTRVPEHPLQ